MKKSPPSFIESARAEAEAESELIALLYREYDAMRDIFTEPLPSVIIALSKERASSTIRIAGSKFGQLYTSIIINERIVALNTEKVLASAFRHVLIHLWQRTIGKQMTHTQQFNAYARQVHATTPSSLRRPPSHHRLLTYICSTGCQMFRTTDSIAVVCVHCGEKMRALSPAAYHKMKDQQREEKERALKNIKKGFTDGTPD